MHGTEGAEALMVAIGEQICLYVFKCYFNFNVAVHIQT